MDNLPKKEFRCKGDQRTQEKDGGRARSYKFLTELQNIKNNQTEVKNTTEMKNTLEGISEESLYIYRLLLMKVKVESEKAGLKLNIQKLRS